jgi:hypothetical protein
VHLSGNVSILPKKYGYIRIALRSKVGVDKVGHLESPINRAATRLFQCP